MAREYTVPYTETAPPHTDRVVDTPWETAALLEMDQFNWYEGGPQPRTTARFLFDDTALYSQFHVEDDEISSEVTELNGPTYQDSSVELFADAGARDYYFNFEVNCCGYFLLAWQPYDPAELEGDRDVIAPEMAERIALTSSIEGPTREPHPEDEEWWLTATIPFEVLSAVTGRNVAPTSGDVWEANVYRSGVPSSQLASWSPILTDEHEYHSPEYFGRFVFV